MAKRSNPEIDARIAALRAAHKSEREISDVLRREGHKIGASGVHRALGRLGKAKPRSGSAGPERKSKRSKAPFAAPLTNAAVTAPEPAEIETSLRTSLGHLERTAKAAEKTGDLKVVVAAARAITQLAPTLAKLTPQPAPDIDESPDMVKAGKLALKTMIEAYAAIHAETS